jgi:hypothetical protein
MTPIQTLRDWLADHTVRTNREQADSVESIFADLPTASDSVTDIGHAFAKALCIVGICAALAALFAERLL